MEEDYYIEFLNKDKNFKLDIKHFSQYEEALEWGKNNLENFHIDMIRRSR
jgi:hypothetical protein